MLLFLTFDILIFVFKFSIISPFVLPFVFSSNKIGKKKKKTLLEEDIM